MIALLAAACGALLGALVARRRRGDAFDIAQYAAGFGIAAFALAVLAFAVLRALT